MCETLQAVYKTRATTEATTTEDCLFKIAELNAKIHRGKVKSDNLMIGSLDVTTPSMQERYAETKSELSIEGVDYIQALIYLKLTMKPHEIVDAKVQGILPKKLAKDGKNPGIKSVGADDIHKRWWYPVTPNKLTPEQSKLVMGCVVE